MEAMAQLMDTKAWGPSEITALSPAEQEFVARAARFAETEVAPFTREWEKDHFPADIWTKLGSLGLLGMAVPAEHGGSDVSCMAYAEVCRILAQADPALSMNVAAVNALCAAHFNDFATDEQRAKYLPGVLSGDIKMAWGLTEPDAGSDARRVQSTATPDPDQPGYFRLNGQKMFITNGGKADLIIIIARTGEKDLSAFFLETTDPGFILGERIETVGVKASWTSQFELKDAMGWHTPCRFEEAIGLLYRGRIGIAAMAVGIAEKALSEMVAYSKQREQFNRRLADMQSVQNMIAESAVEVEAARLLLHDAAARFDRGEDPVKCSSMAKYYASQAAKNATNNAVQIHGGRGMTMEFLAEKLWRDAKLTEIGEGCSEIQKMVIAKQLIGR
jgi:alkylation response protein AidB-like acyl-CoA dehydrogenase